MRIPIKFVGGQVQKVIDGTDEYFAQLLALTAQIRPGELILTPDYGAADPAFSEEAKKQLAFIAGAFIPEIVLTGVEITQDDTGEVGISISFARRT